MCTGLEVSGQTPCIQILESDICVYERNELPLNNTLPYDVTMLDSCKIFKLFTLSHPYHVRSF